MTGTETESTGRASAPAGTETRRRRRLSWGLQRYLGIEVLKVVLFVLLLIEIGYALLIAVVVSRRWDVDLILVVPVLWRTALSMLNDSVPLALLFGAGLVFGRLVSDREVSALKSFGLSFRDLVMPLVLIGGLSALAGVGVVGFIAPEMNYAKSDVAGLLATQLRNLGEGWNRSFRFGNYNLWITHYSGADLEGLTLQPQQGKSAQSFLPENIPEAAADSIFFYAAHGRVMTPDEARADWARNRGLTDDEDSELPEAIAKSLGAPESEGPPNWSDSAIVFRLTDVVVFFSNELLEPGEPSGYRHRLDLPRFYPSYDPEALPKVGRLPKQLSLPALWRRLDDTRSAAAKAPQNTDLSRDVVELGTELHARFASIASFFLYPVLAGLIALFLNAENRYVAFFVSCLIVPTTYYGLGTVGRILASDGHAPALVMYLGTGVLALLFVVGCTWMDRRYLR